MSAAESVEPGWVSHAVKMATFSVTNLLFHLVIVPFYIIGRFSWVVWAGKLLKVRERKSEVSVLILNPHFRFSHCSWPEILLWEMGGSIWLCYNARPDYQTAQVRQKRAKVSSHFGLKKCTSSCFILFLQRIWFCNIQRCHCSAGCRHAGSSYARQQNSWFHTANSVALLHILNTIFNCSRNTRSLL